MTTPVPVSPSGPSVTGESFALEIIGTPWEGILAVEGVETGDGRQFSLGALSWEDPTLVNIPLRWNIEESHGGEPRSTTVDVGRITKIWRDPENEAIIRGGGVFDDNGQYGSEALRRVREGFLRGVSIDPDNISNADVELVYTDTSEEVFHLPGKHNQAEHGGARTRRLQKSAIKSAKKRGVRVTEVKPGEGRRGPSYAVDVDDDDIDDVNDTETPEQDDDDGIDDIMKMFQPPSKTIFHNGRIRAATLVSIPAFVEAKIWLIDPTTVETSIVAAGHFTAWSTQPWNGSAYERNMLNDYSLVSRAYAHFTSHDKMDAHFLHHEVDADGTVGLANLAACAAGIRAIESGRTSLDVADRMRAHAHLAEHLRAAGRHVDDLQLDVSASALTAALGNVSAPPSEWFAMPEPSTYQALQIGEPNESGWRPITGHGAAWGTCHTSFPGACTEVPREGIHSYFRLGEVVCADGSSVAVGNITMGVGHAPTRGITAAQAVEHYDNTNTVVALVASTEGRHGIWLSGVIPPWVSEDRIALLRGVGQVSGDWRRIGGKMRLVAFLAVPRPGFPVLRVGMQRGQQVSLVAAGMSPDPTYIDPTMRAVMRRIAASIGRDPKSRAEEIRKRVKG